MIIQSLHGPYCQGRDRFKTSSSRHMESMQLCYDGMSLDSAIGDEATD
jgi:hypothetical protein